MPATRRRAVVDLGSNSFRLVLYEAVPGVWWRRVDEIHEAVRVGEGLAATGRLGEAPMARATELLGLFASFCASAGLEPGQVDAVATSAVRDAENREDFLARAREASGLDVRVLPWEEEARYGLLAVVNSSTLRRGVVLDLGGGSLQLTRVEDRRARASASWPLGAVRVTERLLADGEPVGKKALKAVRAHVREELEAAAWLPDAGDRLVGIGGTVRNLAAAAQARAELPSIGVQGFCLRADALDDLVRELASRPAAERGRLDGIKPQRGDVILAGALVVQTVLEVGGFAAIEATEAGLREGVFFERWLHPADPPLLEDVRAASVMNLAAQFHEDLDHPRHVAALALQMWDALGAAGAHTEDPVERELLWAAALLHDVGMAVDYDDHHRHSRYLVLSAGLPGFTQREVVLVAQACRYHRKGEVALGPFAALCRDDDLAWLERAAALLRIAESLERSRDGRVRAARLDAPANGTGPWTLRPDSDDGAAVERWVAARHVPQFERAFGRPLEIAAP